MTKAETIIQISRETDAIQHIDYDADVASDLDALCDDHGDCDWWGADWRIQMAVVARQSEAEADRAEADRAWHSDCAAAHAATCRDEAEDIMALAYESAVAGDLEQDAICRLAVAGDEAALAECHRVLADAQAQED